MPKLYVVVTSHGNVGHAYVGLQGNSGPIDFTGFYPKEQGIDRLNGPGEVRNDTNNFYNDPSAIAKSFEISESQYNKIKDYIDGKFKNPGTYDVGGDNGTNCADYANGAMGAGDIGFDIGDIFTDEELKDSPVGSYIDYVYGDGSLISDPTSAGTGVIAPIVNGIINYIDDIFDDISPIAFDLDGNGIKYQSIQNSRVFFDIDGDHFLEHVEWLDKNDGWLARDLNNNGRIDDATELFGQTGGTTAYAKLKALDSNKDGVITSADNAFSSLRIWQDSNQNGRTEAGELKTLQSLKISSISLQQSDANYLDDHLVAGTSSFIMNGKSFQAADVLLETNQSDSWYTWKGDNDISIDSETFFLPQSRGYGVLPTFYLAMSKNAAFKELVKDFAFLDIKTEMHTVYDKVHEILYQWAGGKPAKANYYSNDPIKTAVLNKLTDSPDDGECRPGMNAGFAALQSEMLVRLLVQGPMSNIFDKANYSYTSDKIKLNESIASILTDAKKYVPTTSIEKTTYWNEIARILTNCSDELKLTDAAIMAKVDQAAGFKTYVIDYLGTLGADELTVNNLDTAGHLYDMGGGGDTIYAGIGNDTFFINANSGKTIIDGNIGTDTLIMRAGIGNVGATYTYNNWGEVTGVKFTGANLEIQTSGIEKFVFSDGTVRTLPQLDTYIVTKNSTTGNDVIYTQYGGLTIAPGKGNDSVNITKGANTVIINQGDGQDTIVGNNDDVIRFGAGIVFNNLKIIHDDTNSLKLGLPGNGSVTLNLYNDNASIQTFKFADGTTKTLADIAIKYLPGAATTGNDSIYGFNDFHNVITGGKGDDLLIGAPQSLSTRFIYNLGDGNDTIAGFNAAGNSVLQFGAGITLNNIKVFNELRSNPGPFDSASLVIQMPDGAKIDLGALDKIQFADGTVKTLVDMQILATRGTNGNDTINGTSNEDYIHGGAGNDLIMGYQGSDTLDGGTGSDTLDGGYDFSKDIYIITKQANTITYIRNFSFEYDRLVLVGFKQSVNFADLDFDTSFWPVINLEDGQKIYIRGILSSNGSTYYNQLNANNFLNAKLVNGTVAAESLTGTAGNDIIRGQAGNDTLASGQGNDSLTGGDGIDTFIVTRAANAKTIITDFNPSNEVIKLKGFTLPTDYAKLLITQDGTNAIVTLQDGQTLTLVNVNKSSLTPRAFGYVAPPTFNGTANADNLAGTANADILNGLAGNDTLAGGLGADTLNGGDGVDTASYAAATAAVTINLTTNVHAGTFALGDKLTGIENIIGSIYSDRITGDVNANTFTGGNGNDSLYGGAGNDILYGGAGADYIDGGIGTDILYYSASTAAVTVNLTTNVNTGGDALGDKLVGIEYLIGSAYNDNLTGDTVANRMQGGNGNDTIYGLAGNDTLYGEAGNDILIGGAGADYLDGGAGIDIVTYSNATAAVNINLTTGVHTGRDAAGDRLIGIEQIKGSNFNDVMTGDANANVLNGGNGNDSLYGGAANDTIIGGVGSDYIDGGAGIDTVSYASSTAFVVSDLSINNHWNGDAAWDSIVNVENIIGSNYNDQLTGNTLANALYGGTGNDSLAGGIGADTVDGGVGNDSLYGGNGNDLIIGGAGADYIDGGTGIDTISYANMTNAVNSNLATNNHFNGGSVWDNVINVENIIGSNYNDTLTGSAVANTLSGGAGNDTLYGMAGADRLLGGAGNDIFVFKATSESNVTAFDTIADFQKGDKIDLRGMGYSSVGAGAASGAKLGYVYDTATATTTLTAANGLKIALVGKVDLVGTDFMFA